MANLLEKASIILTPTAYSDGKMHSAKPIVSTNPSIGDFDFARASVATRVNENGLIEEVASGLPRIDYTDGSGSWLLEPTATNLIQYSELFDNAYWTKTGSSVTSGFASLKGDTSAFKLVEDTSAGVHLVKQTSGIAVSGVDYTVSAFVKKAERRYVAIGSSHNSAEGVLAQFDLDTETLIFSGDLGTLYTYVSSNITAMANGWYKISCTFQSTSTFSQPCVSVSNIVYTSGSFQAAANSYTGDGTSGVYIFGAQLEQNSYATSYIKNAGTALGVTRVADTASGSGNSTVINSSEGVLYFEGSAISNDSTFKRIAIATSDNNFVNNINLRYDTNGTSVTYQYRVGNVYQAELTSNVNQTDVNKFACVWKLNRFELWINGVKVSEQLSGSVISANTLDSVFYGKTTSLSEPLYGKTKSIQVYTTALSDAELTALTTI